MRECRFGLSCVTKSISRILALVGCKNLKNILNLKSSTQRKPRLSVFSCSHRSTSHHYLALFTVFAPLQYFVVCKLQQRDTIAAHRNHSHVQALTVLRQRVSIVWTNTNTRATSRFVSTARRKTEQKEIVHCHSLSIGFTAAIARYFELIYQPINQRQQRESHTRNNTIAHKLTGGTHRFIHFP